jgi:hypothetical protein
MPMHPNSLANLRPPYPKGVSGNPKGGVKGRRIRRNLRAERIGKAVQALAPHLATLLERPITPSNWRAFYRATVAELKADPEIAIDATRIADLKMLAAKLVISHPLFELRLPTGRHHCYACAKCGGRFFSDPVPLMHSFKILGWYHDGCLTAELHRIVAEARAALGEAL